MDFQARLYLAPLRGITDRFFRSAYENHFGRFDYMLAPFISTVKGKRARLCHVKDIHPDHNDPERLIPQIIGNDSEGFLILSQTFSDLGFKSVNWNLGCPSPLVTRKKRGSGLLPYTEEIRKFLDYVIPHLPFPLSVKVRLGLEQKSDLDKLIPVFNEYPLKEIIIHPRTGSQMYKGSVDLESFTSCYHQSTHEVIYNGDIRTLSDLHFLSSKFPRTGKWMLGRGIISNPFLLPQIRNRDCHPGIDKVKSFVDELLGVNSRHLPGENSVLGKMKELWSFLAQGLDPSGNLMTRILRTTTVDMYQKEIDSFFSSLPASFSPVSENGVAPSPAE
ncbi:MAG: tRNA-dihydrouridine synthase family protein [Chitinispirillaceae bacterium]